VLEVVVNLATVHLDRGDPGDAAAMVSLLQPLAPGHPDQAELLANLGLAYEKLGDFDEAVRALQRAIVATPHMAELQVHLARLLMEHFGAIGEAAVALELAYQQGFESREWLVRTRACFILLGDQENDAALEAQARSNLAPDVVAAMDAELKDVLARIRGRLSSGD
jgi:tetratricopeptide (TPR) repeat protein